MKPVYECDMCGVCCQGLYVEVGPADVAREPRLAGVVRSGVIRNERAAFGLDATVGLLSAMLSPQKKTQTRWALMMSLANPDKKCDFLSDCKCSIHETRPEACRIYEAGGEPCQQARKRHGLPPLLPKPATDV